MAWQTMAASNNVSRGDNSSKKRKVDQENRVFNQEWTEQFLFICNEKKPLCLICQESISVVKKSNLKRHYETNHNNFEGKYPLGSNARGDQIQKLKQSVGNQRRLMGKFTTAQQRATEASLHVSNIIGKSMMPYKQADTVKECMIAAANVMYPGNSEIIEGMKTLALSRNTCTKRIEDISEDLFRQLITKLENADCYSIAIDESCDILDVAQLAVFVR